VESHGYALPTTAETSGTENNEAEARDAEQRKESWLRKKMHTQQKADKM
jgi:hypothetical protein